MIEFARENNLNHSGRKPSPKAEAFSKQAYDLHQKADAQFLLSRFVEAKPLYQKSLEAYQKAGDPHGEALALVRLGRVGEMLGTYVEARKFYWESLGILEIFDDPSAIARVKAHLGNVAWAMGDYHLALSLLEEALSLYRKREDVAGQAWVLDLIGNVRLAMREDREAERLHAEAFSLAEKQGTTLENKAWDHYHQGALALFRGNTQEAKKRFLEALKSFERLKDDLGQVASFVHLAEIGCAHQDLSAAEQHLVKAVRLVIPTQCKPLLADVLTGIAQFLEAQGNEKKAVGILMVALSHPTCRQQTKDRMVALSMA